MEFFSVGVSSVPKAIPEAKIAVLKISAYADLPLVAKMWYLIRVYGWGIQTRCGNFDHRLEKVFHEN